MAMDRDSVGWWRIPAWKLRQLSGDTSGGVDYGTAATTVSKATYGQVSPIVAYGRAPGDLQTLASAGHAGGISISAAVTVNTPYHTGSFTGGHTIYWGAYRLYSGQNQIAILDPGISNSAVVWWPLSLLLKAAEARTGNGTINLLIFRDTESVIRWPRYAGPVYSAPSVTSSKYGTPLNTASDATVLLTQNGGSWTVTAANRTVSGSGWHKIKYGTGSGFVTGGALK
jgi:hypothetical protein